MRKKRKKSERGSSIIESIMAIFMLFFLFICMLQIFQWVARQMISDYASFEASKVIALGYGSENCRKAARVAAIGMSGQDYSTNSYKVSLGDGRDKMRTQADKYIQYGSGSGVSYEYWTGNETGYLSFNFDYIGDFISAKVTLKDAPLLVPAMGTLLGFDDEGDHPIATGTTQMYNYAGDFLYE